MKDRDYWKAVMAELTPFEFSELVEELYQSDMHFDVLNESMPYSPWFIQRLRTKQVVDLIQELACHDNINSALKAAFSEGWCDEGKEELKKAQQRFAQLKLNIA